MSTNTKGQGLNTFRHGIIKAIQHIIVIAVLEVTWQRYLFEWLRVHIRVGQPARSDFVEAGCGETTRGARARRLASSRGRQNLFSPPT